MEWRSAAWLVCLPLLIFPCTVESRSSLLAPAHSGGPGKRAVKRLCVCVTYHRDNTNTLDCFSGLTPRSVSSHKTEYLGTTGAVFTHATLAGMDISFCRVCLSVCLVISTCSTKMVKRRIMQTMPHDSPRTLVFPMPKISAKLKRWCQMQVQVG